MSFGKAFSKMDREELNDAVDKKTALPDMVLKREYFTFQETMTRAEQQLMMGFYKNGGVYRDIDVIYLRSSILGLFRLISGMISEAGCVTWKSKESELILRKNGVNSDFALCHKLINYAQLDVPTLIHLAGYLNYALHELGLTNLLMNNDGHEIDIADLI